MIKLVRKLDMWGVTSYDVYVEDAPLGCSVIVKTGYELPEGRFVLRPYRGHVRVLNEVEEVVGTIKAGNGVYKTRACTMFCGNLVCGVLCTSGRRWLVLLRNYIKMGEYELVVASPVGREQPLPPPEHTPMYSTSDFVGREPLTQGTRKTQ